MRMQSINHTDYYCPSPSPAVDGWSNLANIPTYCVINSIHLWVYAYKSGNGGGTHAIEYNLNGSAWTRTGLTDTLSSTWNDITMSRPGGGSWARSDIANIDVRGYANGDASRTDRYVYIDGIILRVNWDYITPSLVQTDAATGVTAGVATLNSTINPNGDAGGTYRLVYGTTSGSYDNPSWNAVSGGGSQTPSRSLTGLTAGQTYYFRVEYKNSGGVQTNGSERSFTTLGAAAGLILFF